MQCKLNFADSQDKLGQLGAAKAVSGEGITTLSFDEWLECLARCGCDKYRAVAEMSPAQSVAGFLRNLLNEASPDVVVIEATRVHAKPLRGRPHGLRTRPAGAADVGLRYGS